MPKQRRPAAGRASARTATSRASVKKQKARSASRPSTAAVARAPLARQAVRPNAPKEVEAPPPPPPPRKPAFYEALAVYEAGVRALQRHDFESGAEGFRGVIQRYPDERELVERARLYLQVCERENARRPPTPQTASEWVYAATVALNAGNQDLALSHLARALEKMPDSDHAHYIMAVALTDKGEVTSALKHLEQAISLNPDNRSTALQDPDLSALRDLDAFRDVLGAQGAGRRRVRSRR
jgi:tetratricopeptide (TPR) repeat protein